MVLRDRQLLTWMVPPGLPWLFGRVEWRFGQRNYPAAHREPTFSPRKTIFSAPPSFNVRQADTPIFVVVRASGRVDLLFVAIVHLFRHGVPYVSLIPYLLAVCVTDEKDENQMKKGLCARCAEVNREERKQ
eukprot:scaffold510_cov155-Amphora_coffeaeformis.AAC.4